MNREVVRPQTQTPRSPSPSGAPPAISKTVVRVFGRYTERYLRRHFHSVRLLANSAPRVCEGFPLAIYLNHSSWWDPLVCLFAARRFFPARASYGPIDAVALERYRFLRRLGLFGVESGTSAGARAFLETATAILRGEGNALWITPEGRFSDFHARPVRLEPGLSHLTGHVKRAAFMPLALQYVFWEERLPEILLAFGEPIVFESKQALRVADTTRLFESGLTSVQDHLAIASQRRQREDWKTLLTGRAGTAFAYDAWRKMRARFRGEKFDPEHSPL